MLRTATLKTRLSPRSTGWLPWLAAAVLAVGSAVALVVFLGGDKTDRTAPPAASGQGAVVETKAPLGTDVTSVARTFIHTAVARTRLGVAYDFAGAELRQGMTRAQWAKGEIAVVPYPVAPNGITEMKVDYSYTDHALLEFLLLPRRGATEKPQRFAMELRARGKAGARRWVVVNWVPLGSLPTPRGG